MRSFLALTARAHIGVLVLVLCAARSASAFEPPADLGQWGLHCFCLTARHTPHRVVRMDSNGQILRRAVGGATLADLRASGLTVSDSQILLLRTYDLVDQAGDRVTTKFPIIGPDKIGPLRERLRRLADVTTPALIQDVRSIVERLKANGYPNHAYAVVFGYAFDGIVWDELRHRQALPEIELDLDHPIWRGAFWAIFPERVGVPGTNETALADRSLVAVWTDHTIESINAMMGGQTNAGAELRNKPWLSRIPTIRAVPGDPIHDAAERIAIRTADALMDTAEGHALLEAVPHASRQEATVILAHEFIWDLMEDVLRDHALRPPAVLQAGHPTEEQLMTLLFLRASSRS